MDMDKPPPSYNETFPERQVPNSTPTSGGYESGHVLPDCNTSTELLQEIDTVLNFVSNIDIVTIPGLCCKIRFSYRYNNMYLLKQC